MATTHPSPAQAAAKPHEPRPPAPIVAEQALVPAPPREDLDEAIPQSTPVSRLPVELDVSVPVREFRVRNLLALAPGQLIGTEWVHGEDLPLASGAVQLAWSEFEVVDTQLAVRITRLA